MPKIPEDAQEKHGDMSSIIAATLPNALRLAFQPFVICGVNRKSNIGNWENIDVYAAIAVPIDYYLTDDLDAAEFKKSSEDAAKLGFLIASKEANERYNLIKNGSAEGRKS